MIWPLSETLNCIEPYLPDKLISRQAFSNIKTITNILPEAMSSYYLECRLGADATQVDFLTCATISDGGRAILAGENAPAALLANLLENPGWRRIRDFWGCWADSTSLLYDQIPLIWLEFDQVDAALPKVPLPGSMFCLDPEYLDRRRQSPRSKHVNGQQGKQVTEIACELLLGQPLSAQTRQNLFACFDLLPAGGQIIHISIMLPRQPVTLKIYASVPKDQLLAYLSQIGWSGSIAEFETILTTFCASIEDIKVDLTVAPVIAPKIGLVFSEVQVNNPTQAKTGRPHLIDQCVEKGLCLPEKRDSLLAWPGSFRRTFSHQAWPTRFDRWLDIKIVYQPHQPIEVKGYLGFMPYFSLF